MASVCKRGERRKEKDLNRRKLAVAALYYSEEREERKERKELRSKMSKLSNSPHLPFLNTAFVKPAVTDRI